MAYLSFVSSRSFHKTARYLGFGGLPSDADAICRSPEPWRSIFMCMNYECRVLAPTRPTLSFRTNIYSSASVTDSPWPWYKIGGNNNFRPRSIDIICWGVNGSTRWEKRGVHSSLTQLCDFRRRVMRRHNLHRHETSVAAQQYNFAGKLAIVWILECWVGYE